MEKIKGWAYVIAVLVGLGVVSIGFASKESVMELDKRVTVIEAAQIHLATKADLAEMKNEIIEAFRKGR